MRGRAEHDGNRNYYGQERIDAAPQGAIYRNLKRIATLRRDSVALQRGLQFNLKLKGDEAAFYRVYEHEGQAQTALVLLNKGDAARTIAVDDLIEAGDWRDGFSGETVKLGDRLALEVPAHGVRVLFLERPLALQPLREKLLYSMAHKDRCAP